MEKFLQETIRTAGKIALKKFGKVGVKYTKSSPTDVVTEADLAVDDFIVCTIKKKYPSHGIISEENGEHQSGAEYVWIIDPIDGTRNFSKAAPLFAVMIGLARNGKMELGAVYDPSMDELVLARRGKGTFLNGQRVRGSDCKKWAESWGSLTSRFSDNGRKIIAQFMDHKPREPFWANSFGCIGINAIYLASGRRDWCVSSGSCLWDYAAVSIILKEAGYRVTNFKGKEWSFGDKELLAANKYLYPKLLKILG
ncbi:MAG: hypothetical protein A3B23_01625 [Candidatus Colwellbacteria bacterium RIFCSPLOWO2_01_FULL_48_10]|uniref:Inositol-1-monophosphatase n=1 Tax=Candidatus Colwellbacteria bacterium RIFCSPLOWO2_01_FULL_48_10 TaxID=1797690 RepID=A0A1G1Z6W7_9BACT|nr:MAG: hypothetical protein A3B23_01625 [Candidatus Colwellbacteria bacterium RIFCSPLOWO2_01_FULL_48_10]